VSRRRPDTTLRHLRRWFVRWLLGDESLTDLAATFAVTRQTVAEWFAPLWDEPLPEPKPVDVTGQVLIVDGVGLARRAVALVGRTLRQVAAWVFTTGESTEDWLAFTDRIVGAPWAVVLDGRAGLLAAVQLCWPTALIQRCHFHVVKRARQLLTQEPKLRAGQEIRRLVLDLKKVRTRRQKRRWLRAYRKWERRYEWFLAEKTISTERTRTGLLRWRYTHPKLRSVRSLVRNVLPHLFTYVRHPAIPRTTNHVEGGLNSTLKDLIHQHRGLPLTHKQRLAALFFASKQ
jgi:hypothetical protein